MILKVGNNRWSLPIPLVQARRTMALRQRRGRAELINRWIGRYEIAAIRTALAYVDAQKASVR